MLMQLVEPLHAPTAENLSRAFARLGRTGFWVQVVLGSIPVVLMVYAFVFAASPTGPRAGLAIVQHLTVVSLLLLAFTTFWFWRYTGLAPSLANPSTRPPEESVIRTVWIGLVASSLGVAVSLGILLIEVAHLLFYFLSVPQGGVPVIQTTGVANVSWVSAIDMLSVMALLLTLAAELVALVFGLWLLFRTTQVYAGKA